jgi:hypothetical protein
MLKYEVIDADLVAATVSLTGTLDADLQQFVDTDDAVCSIDYPVNRYPKRKKGSDPFFNSRCLLLMMPTQILIKYSHTPS